MPGAATGRSVKPAGHQEERFSQRISGLATPGGQNRPEQREEGKIVRMETDLDPDEALEAAGLLE